MDRLQQYEWPGNVRELEHVIERGAILSDGEEFRLPELTPAYQPAETTSGGLTFRQMEKSHLLWALQKTGGKIYGRDGAAELLDLHPNSLHSKMKRLGIAKPSRQDPDAPDDDQSGGGN